MLSLFFKIFIAKNDATPLFQDVRVKPDHAVGVLVDSAGHGTVWPAWGNIPILGRGTPFARNTLHPQRQ